MQKQEIKAVPVYYKGYLMRSTLEARYATFLDTAEIRWEYEPQTYEMKNSKRYLPDFYLPDDDIYLEVKGPQESVEYFKEKIEPFSKEMNKRIVYARGILDEDKCWLYKPELEMWRRCVLLPCSLYQFNKNRRFGKLQIVEFDSRHFTEKEIIEAHIELMVEGMYAKRKIAIDAMKQASFDFFKHPKHA